MLTVFAVLDPGRNQTVIHVAVLGPLAIGMAIFVAHLALIPIDGATARMHASLVSAAYKRTHHAGTSINPARSLGPAVAHGTWYKHWIFWLGAAVNKSDWLREPEPAIRATGPMTGAAFAAVVYETTLKGHTRAELAIRPRPERKPAAVETAVGAAPPPPNMRREE